MDYFFYLFCAVVLIVGGIALFLAYLKFSSYLFKRRIENEEGIRRARFLESLGAPDWVRFNKAIGRTAPKRLRRFYATEPFAERLHFFQGECLGFIPLVEEVLTDWLVVTQTGVAFAELNEDFVYLRRGPVAENVVFMVGEGNEEIVLAEDIDDFLDELEIRDRHPLK